MQPRRVAILLFDNVEVLDFAGPFEVFAVAGWRQHPKPFDVYTVAQSERTVLARNNLRVEPDYSFATCPTPDVLVVPGGFGTRREQHNADLIGFVQRQAAQAEAVLSVCTGSILLARAGMLEGKRATTHYMAYEALRSAAQCVEVVETARYVDAGKIVTSAGISAGIDASLYLVARLAGEEMAAETAAYMQYEWRRN